VDVDEAKLAALCRRYEVRELSVFGSAARGEMRPDSDIDILVEFLPGASVDLVDYAGLMIDLSDLFGRKVDRHPRQSSSRCPSRAPACGERSPASKPLRH
jgi:uncharacterized protein